MAAGALLLAGASPLSAAFYQLTLRADPDRVPADGVSEVVISVEVVDALAEGVLRRGKLALALGELLEGPVREVQLAHLERVRQRLGAPGAAERAAAIAQEMACGAGGA